MNDSLLEELNEGLVISKDINEGLGHRQIGKNITTRCYLPDVPSTNSPNEQTPGGIKNVREQQSPMLNLLEDKLNIFQHSGGKNTNTESKSQDSKKRHKEVEKRLTDSRSKVCSKGKSLDSKLKPVENRVKVDVKTIKMKILDNKTFVKDRHSRLSNSKESSRSSDASSKENNHPIDSPRVISEFQSADCLKDRIRDSKHSSKKSSSVFSDNNANPTILLSAIKELISTYTKAESLKIQRSIQDLHINSQANLVRQMLIQTDDIVKELQPIKDSSQLRALVQENERMKQDIMILQFRNEDLRKIAEEAALLREENIALKLKLKELTK